MTVSWKTSGRGVPHFSTNRVSLVFLHELSFCDDVWGLDDHSLTEFRGLMPWLRCSKFCWKGRVAITCLIYSNSFWTCHKVVTSL